MFAVAFLAVAREGIELALLLVATALQGSFAATGLGVALGLGVAVGFGTLLYRGVLRLNLAVFFRITNALLLLFAAGMIGLAAHELIEAGQLPAIVEPLWNFNLILSDQSAPGALLRSLFGYNSAPTLTEALAYLAYLGAIGWALWRRQASGQVGTARRQPRRPDRSQSVSKQRAALPKQTARRRAPARTRRTSWAWIGGGLLAVALVVGGIWLATRSGDRPRRGNAFRSRANSILKPARRTRSTTPTRRPRAGTTTRRWLPVSMSSPWLTSRWSTTSNTVTW